MESCRMMTSDTIAGGIRFSRVSDEKFKSSRISLNLIVPLESETASVNAIQPLLWQKGCLSCPDFTLLNRRLDGMYGAALYGDVLKFGGYQILSLSISGLYDRFTMENRALVREYAGLLCDLVLEPKIYGGRFDETDIETEKLNLLDTIDAEINDKRSYAVGKCLSYMYEGTNSAVKKLGERADAERITPESAAKAYDRIAKTAAVEIVFVGCGGADDAMEVFQRRLGGIKRRVISYDPKPPVIPEREPRFISERMDVTQGKLVMALRGQTGLDMRGKLAARVMSALLGGTAFSLLFKNVRERMSLCYYCLSRYDRGTGTLLLDSGVETSKAGAAREEMLRQLDDIKAGRFSDEDFGHTLLSMKNSLRSVGDSLSSLEAWYSTQIFTGGAMSPAEEEELMQTLTRDDISRAAAGFRLDTVFLLEGADGE